jgi:manganese oxidase
MAHRVLAAAAALGLAAFHTPRTGWEQRTAASPAGADPHIATSDNRHPAGRLEHGVLTVHLEARNGTWYPEGTKGMGLRVAAWAEEGKLLQNPGPLIRVPAGTEIRATVRNALPDRAMTVYGFGDRQAAPPDSFRLASGEAREVRFRAPAPGTYYYGATTGAQPFLLRRRDDSQLNGAIVVHAPGAPATDRVFLISWWLHDVDSTTGEPPERGTMVINGRSWPHTERLRMSVGDTVHWRWINVTAAPHPMHLHGFYFRVDAKSDGVRDTLYAPAERRLAVTERLASGQTMALTWAPERPGNWLFHCHFARHISHHARPGESLPESGDHTHHAPPSAQQGQHSMAGLVLGIHVDPGRGVRHARSVREPRRLRLLVRSTVGPNGEPPAYAYALQDGATEPPPDTMPLPGPALILEKGQPVAITVVNRAHEPTAVHWHGIELESFPDGVPNWSGERRRRLLQWAFPPPLLRPIPPGDSLTVRFTPPRAGTFMYHSHFNEMQQIGGGLYGPIIVMEPGKRFDPQTDRVLLLSRAGSEVRSPVLLNGRADATIDLRVGATYRLRFVNIFANGGVLVALLDGDVPARWRPLAKDGADLPPAQATVRPARFGIAAGEIYDFEFTPPAPGDLALRLDLRGTISVVPVRVR